MTPVERAVLSAADQWERLHAGWQTRPRDVPEPQPPTTQAQLHEACDVLTSAVRALRAERGKR